MILDKTGSNLLLQAKEIGFRNEITLSQALSYTGITPQY